MSIINYHKHTTWSNFFQADSATSIEDFMKRSDELGSHVYYSGEHGYPGEWLYCWNLCKQTEDEKFREKLGLSSPFKFRYSAEIYWVKDPNLELKDRTNCHMVLVAKNYNAIRKLTYIISVANEDNYYYKPRVGIDQIMSLSPDDVFCTSACVAGWKYDDADEIWIKLAKHFGDSFFFEYQYHNTIEQKRLNKHIYEMSQKYGIQTIVGLDTHYINEEDRIKRDKYLERKKIHYDDEDGWYMDYPDDDTIFKRFMEQGVLPEDEILKAMYNTNLIDNGCEDIEYDTGFKIPIMDKYKNLTYDQRADVLLEFLKSQYDKEDTEHHTKDRYDGMMYEFGEIRDSGTVDYFLDNQAIVSNAVKNHGGHLTTTSRGSASSYYCSKLCGFTTMDRFEAEVPIYPERFITKDRILASKQMPDIDLNIERQEPFRDSAREIFGRYSCYPLLAVGKLKEKSAFKMYAGVNDVEPSVANDITTLIDKYNEDLKNADDDDKDSINIKDYIKDKRYLRLYEESIPYQSIVEQAKVHACGFGLFNGNPRQPDVVGYGDLRYEIGLIRCHSESTGKSTVVLNIEGGLLDSLGFVKDDFLIVDVVGLIYEFYHAIGREVPTVTELRKMVNGDKKVWDLYANGITCCLNQCEKEGTRQKVMVYKPQSIKELAAFIAAIRPGFKSQVNGFLNREYYTNGEKAIDDLLKDSFKYMLYQEAVMKVFGYLGIPMKDSYDTIKKISKKKLKGEALKHAEDTLREHWKEKIGDLRNFDKVYRIIKDSARYSFNSPHALAMACDSLYEAYIKAHYPSLFYEVAMNHYQRKGDKNKVSELRHEAIDKMDYNIGHYKFGIDSTKVTADDKTRTIYPDLGSIKGIGELVGEELNKVYSEKHKSLCGVYVAAKKHGIKKTILLSLAKIGYFSDYGSSKFIVNCFRMFEAFLKRKTIKISELLDETLGGSEYISKKKDISKSATIIDHIGFLTQMSRYLPKEEYGIAVIASNHTQVLGYCDVIDPTIEWNYCVVIGVDTKYSPKITLYSINNGKIQIMKIHRRTPKNDGNIKTWSKLELFVNDVIYVSRYDREKVRKKINGDWQETDEREWWLNDYYLVYRPEDDTNE